MKDFCKKFFGQEPHDIDACPQCKAAAEEVKREEQILSRVDGPLYHRTTLEQAALDHNGQP